MGTRNLTVVVVDGKNVVAQYGHWDGYPAGQGRVALEFCREHLASEAGRDAFKRKLSSCRFATAKALEEGYKSVGVVGDWLTTEQAIHFGELFPFLSRNHGAGVLGLISKHSGGPILLQDSSDFAGDSLFCEWAYVIDLDKNALEAFMGGNHKPLDDSDRFAKAPVDDRHKGKYYPIRLSGTWNLDSLPSFEEFESKLEREESEEEPRHAS
jgi:hypothetical protein